MKDRLRLPAFRDEAAEAAFWAHHDAQSHASRLTFMVVAQIVYAAFALMDVRMGGEATADLLAVRLSCLAIMVCATIRFAMPSSGAVTRERTILLLGASSVWAQIVMIVLVPAAAVQQYQFGMCAIMSLGAIMVAPRFRTTLMIFGTAIGFFLLSIPLQPGEPDAKATSVVFNLLVAGAILAGSFERERLARLQAITSDRLAGANADLTASRIEAIEARDAAIAANRSKNHFLANMSHELRTPLNAILGFSDMIRSEMFGPLNEPRYASYIEHIHASGTLLQTNIDDLLDLARLESGKFGWEDEEVSLRGTVEGAIAPCRMQAEDAGVALILDTGGDDPVVRVDPARLAQAVINLVTNALKFTDAGGTVRIATARAADGGCLVRVADTGCGMSAEDLERVRTPFAQAHEDSYSKGKGGLGLGLAIVGGIVAQADGALDLESEQGAGTVATIRLPASRVDDQLSDAA